MTLRNELLAKLRADKAALRRFGVKSIAIFGSVARGEAGPKSDVDVLVVYGPSATPGLFEFMDLKDHLERLFGRRVDLATPDALHRALRKDVLREAVYA
jgi:predicted nucleotidyltransferase